MVGWLVGWLVGLLVCMTMYGTRGLWESQEHLSKEGPCAAAVVEGSVSRDRDVEGLRHGLA